MLDVTDLTAATILITSLSCVFLSTQCFYSNPTKNLGSGVLSGFLCGHAISPLLFRSIRLGFKSVMLRIDAAAEVLTVNKVIIFGNKNVSLDSSRITAAGSELLAQAEENALVVRVAHSTRTAPLPFYCLHSTSFYLSTRQANSQAHIGNFFQ